MSREEELLRGLIDGASVDVEPQSRSEAYLKAMIDGDDVSELGEPQTRIEELYSELADVIEGGGGGGGSHTLITPLSVEENGTYTAPEGTAYSPVTVNVPTGGGGSKVEEKDVNFYDYDGTVLYSYTKDEFLALDTMPGNPDRTDEGLTAQGWNWTYTEARDYIQKYGICDIGQMYTTTDGKTRIDIYLPNGATHPYLGLCVNGTVDVDWGDGTEHAILTGTSLTTPVVTDAHQYSAPGSYTIALTVVDGTIGFSGSVSYNNGSYLLRAFKKTGTSDTNNIVYANAIRSVRIGANVSIISAGSFYGCGRLASITIPAETLEFRGSSFNNTDSLRAIVLPMGLTLSGTASGYMFSSARSLSVVCMPNVGTIIRDQASNFVNTCVGRVIIPSTTTQIASSVFSHAEKMTSVTIPDSVTNIKSSAFADCYSLTEVHFTSMTPPTLQYSVFSNVPKNCKIYVPTGTLEAYTTASNYPSSSTYTYIEE